MVDDFEGFMSKAAFHALKTHKIAPGGHVWLTNYFLFLLCFAPGICFCCKQTHQIFGIWQMEGGTRYLPIVVGRSQVRHFTSFCCNLFVTTRTYSLCNSFGIPLVWPDVLCVENTLAPIDAFETVLPCVNAFRPRLVFRVCARHCQLRVANTSICQGPSKDATEMNKLDREVVLSCRFV